jgi:hypothetical protein
MFRAVAEPKNNTYHEEHEEHEEKEIELHLSHALCG